MKPAATFFLGAVTGVVLGGLCGFFLGVRSTTAGKEFIEDMFTTEQAAAVQEPVTLERASFSLSYPRNWKIDDKDEDYQPDHMFSIDSPGDCFVMLTLLDAATDSATTVKDQAELYEDKLIKGAHRTPFTRWGRYAGAGLELKGKMLGITPGTVRIFSHATASRSFVAIESCYDEDRAMTAPGFELIASSFQLRGGTNPAPP